MVQILTHNYTDNFLALYIIYIIFALVSLYLTNYLLNVGSQANILYWLMFGINIMLFIIINYFIFLDPHIGAIGILLFQAVINIIVLVATSDICGVNNITQSKFMTTYTIAIISYVLLFLFGTGALLLN